MTGKILPFFHSWKKTENSFCHGKHNECANLDYCWMITCKCRKCYGDSVNQWTKTLSNNAKMYVVKYWELHTGCMPTTGCTLFFQCWFNMTLPWPKITQNYTLCKGKHQHSLVEENNKVQYKEAVNKPNDTLWEVLQLTADTCNAHSLFIHCWPQNIQHLTANSALHWCSAIN